MKVSILPKTIAVLGKKLRIKTVPRDVLDKNGNLDGLYDKNKMEITLAEDLDDSRMRHTLWHELTHAYTCISGFTSVLTNRNEEMLCELLENQVDLFYTKWFRNVFLKLPKPKKEKIKNEGYKDNTNAKSEYKQEQKNKLRKL